MNQPTPILKGLAINGWQIISQSRWSFWGNKPTRFTIHQSTHSFTHPSINPSYLSHQSHSSSLPSSVTFQLPVTIKNITVNQCIIDEGESTCVMSAHVWKWLGSTELVPSTITLRAYDGCPSQPEGLYQNVPIERVRLFSLMSRLFMLDWIRISSSSVVTCMLWKLWPLPCFVWWCSRIMGIFSLSINWRTTTRNISSNPTMFYPLLRGTKLFSFSRMSALESFKILLYLAHIMVLPLLCWYPVPPTCALCPQPITPLIPHLLRRKHHPSNHSMSPLLLSL